MEGKLTNAKWAAMAKCSSVTALRDTNDLMAKDVLARQEGGGRNTAYILVKWAASSLSISSISYQKTSVHNIDSHRPRMSKHFSRDGAQLRHWLSLPPP